MSVHVEMQPTPNPNSVKFVVDRPVVEQGSKSYMSPQEAEVSPLAKAIFDLGGVTSVFMLGNFISVNKESGADWTELAPRVVEAIQENL